MKTRALRQIGKRTLCFDPLLDDIETIRRALCHRPGESNPARIFIVVLLPAPFGPTNNVISFGSAPAKSRARLSCAR